MKINYSPEFPKILEELKCTVAISTYESGVVVFVSSLNGKHITQFAKNLKRPMGIAEGADGRIAIACKDTIEVYGTHRKLSLNYPEAPAKYDALFFPRATYYTGQLDIHDLVWSNNSLIGVNTAFSCIARITDTRSFENIWQPSFITESVPEDRCHLNGFTTDGTSSYVTLLGRSDERQGWRKNKLESGLLMNMETEEVLVDKLPMPHSPRLVQGKLFYLLSAIGEIHYYDFEQQTSFQFAKVDGFVRGLSQHGDYLFVGLSTIRENSKSFGQLPVASKTNRAGMKVYSISTGEKVAEFFYEEKIKEIFDVSIIRGLRHAVILDKAGKIHTRAVNVSEDIYFWKKETIKAKQEN